MLRIALFVILLVAAAVYALRKGGGPERAMAMILLAMAASDQILHLFIPARCCKHLRGESRLRAGWSPQLDFDLASLCPTEPESRKRLLRRRQSCVSYSSPSSRALPPGQQAGFSWARNHSGMN